LRFLPPSSPQYAALLYFPWILWLSAKPILSPGRAILLALLIALQCLVETVYVAPAVVAPIAVLAAVLLLRGETRARGLRLAIALLGGLLLVSPVYLAYLHVMDQNPNLGQQTSWPSDPRAPRSFEDLLLWTFQVPVSAVWITPLTLILAALGLFAFLRRRRSTTPEGWRRAFTQGLLWFVVCLLLSLAPRLRLGDEVIRLPLGYLQDWFSALQALRVPGRVALGSLIGLAVLAGVAFAAIEAWLRTGIADARRASAAVIALSAVAGCAAYLQDKELSYPVRLSQSPQVDAALLPALRAGRGPMVVLPPDGYPNARAMFQSIYHWRPILNGYSSYWPDGFAERMARAKRLPHPQALEKLVKETRLKLVWLNLRGELTRRQRQAWARAVKQGRFRQVATTDEVWLLRVQPAPPRPTPQASVLQGQPASSPASGGGT
jgi:hypothetical protein